MYKILISASIIFGLLALAWMLILPFLLRVGAKADRKLYEESDCDIPIQETKGAKFTADEKVKQFEKHLKKPQGNYNNV